MCVLSQEEWKSRRKIVVETWVAVLQQPRCSALEPWEAMDGKGRQGLRSVAPVIKFCTKWDTIKADFKHNN